jgi:hypothetical protein
MAALGSRERGGGIPKTGLYQLHEGETVIPSEKTLQQMLVERIAGDKMKSAGRGRTKGVKKRSYQTGTDDAQAMMDLVMSRLGIRPGIGRAQPPRTEGELREEVERRRGSMEGFSMPGGSRPGLFGEGSAAAGPSPYKLPPEPTVKEGVEGPPVPPEYEAPLEIEGVEAFEPSAGYERSKVTKTEGEGGIPSYELTSVPETGNEKMDAALKKAADEIDNLRSAARRHSDAASSFMMYAHERPNSPAADKMMEMATNRMAMSKQFEGQGMRLQKQMDDRIARMSEALATTQAAAMEAGGQRARAGATQSKGVMDFAGSLATALAGMEDADPEMVQQVIMALLQQGGFQLPTGEE